MAQDYLPKIKKTKLTDKMRYVFDDIAEIRENEPHYLFANSKVEQTIIFYSSAEGYYIVDYNDIFIQEHISHVLRQYGDALGETGDTEIVRNSRSVKNWFDTRVSGDIPKLIKLYKEELVVHGLIKKPEEFQRFSFYDREENFILMNMKSSAIKIDLTTRETTEIDFSHLHNFLSKLDVEYIPEENDELWEKTIQEIIPDKNSRELLRNWCAYTLINKYFNWQCSILLYGPRANNGKTTFMEAWGSLFQTMVSTTLVRISKQFGLRQLFEADFIIADESDAKFNDTAHLKKLIEGKDLTIEGKGSNEFTAMIDGKMMIATNKLAQELIQDEGMMRRIEVIITPKSFYDNDKTDLKYDLLKIKSTIFNWGLKAIFNVIENVSKFKKGVKERTKALYISNETPFGNFFAEFGILDPDGECYLDDLTYYYEEFSKKYQTETLTNTKLGIILKEDIPDLTKKSSRSKRFKSQYTTIYTGLRLNFQKLSEKLGLSDPTEELPTLDSYDFGNWSEDTINLK